MKRLILTASIAALTVFLLLQECAAAIRPSFFLEECVWKSTDIVVVRGEKFDGRLTVLETWKGSLTKGNVITVPELARYVPQVSGSPLGLPIVTQPDKPVTGKRMILFLVRSEVPAGVTSRPSTRPLGAPIVWRKAVEFGDMNVSMVWVENGQVFNFDQIENPGPSLLVSREQNEERFKKEVEAVLAAQVATQKALAIADRGERARALKPMAGFGRYFNMQAAAFDGIAACGVDGVPVLREMLRNDSYDQRTVVVTLVKAAGKEAGPEVTTVLKDELPYWQQIGPTLKVGWWNRMDTPNLNRYRNRYGGLYACLFSLKDLKYRDAKDVVIAVRDFWRSLPQLDDRSGLNQIAQECEAYLQAIGEPVGP